MDNHFEQLAEVFNACPELEIAFAPIGTTKFNTAKHYKEITAKELETIAKMKINVSFVNGLRQGLNGQRSKGQDVILKNILPFDADCKDFDKELLNITPKERLEKLELIVDKFLPKLKELFALPCLIVFSGNGLHFLFRLKTPIEVGQYYEVCYEHLRKFLQTRIFQDELIFDSSFKQPAHLIRLPESTNWKEKNNPIETKILFHDPNADALAPIQAQFKLGLKHYLPTDRSIEGKYRSHSTDIKANNHKEHLRNALTFNDVFRYFGYDKFGSITHKGEQFLCSSPFREDKNPSFSFNVSKQTFYDFADDKAGDIFDLIGLFSKLNSQTEFSQIIQIAETITGIKKPMRTTGKATLQVIDGGGSQDSTPSKKKTRASVPEFFEFFNEHLKPCKRDILSDELMTKQNEQWIPAINEVSVLESYAIESDGYYPRSHIVPHLARFAKQIKPELLVTIPEWDKKDRILTICECLESNFSTKEIYDLLCDWLSKLFQRLENPQTQNRLLLFIGKQGLGKDYLIDTITGYLGQFAINLTVPKFAEDTELKRLLHCCLVAKISEFDRADPAILKDLITTDNTHVRLPYDKSAKRRFTHCSYIASCNKRHPLVDHTGNRRFIIVELKSIKHSYPSSINDKAQILAQAKYLAQNHFKASKETEKKLLECLEEHTPEDPEEIILEDFDRALSNLSCAPVKEQDNVKYYSQAQTQDIFISLSKAHGCSVPKIRNIAKHKRQKSVKLGPNKTERLWLCLSQKEDNEECF